MKFISTLFRASEQPPIQEGDTAFLQTLSSAIEEQQSTSSEGELLVDMYERDDALIVRAFVAGVEPENLEIVLDGDILTIRGQRQEVEEIHDDRFFYRECYWGVFSRSLLLPSPIALENIRALFKNGVVYIELPKNNGY